MQRKGADFGLESSPPIDYSQLFGIPQITAPHAPYLRAYCLPEVNNKLLVIVFTEH